MISVCNQLADLQDEFKQLHRNYGKMPRWQFMLKSVVIVDKMRLLENIIYKKINDEYTNETQRSN